MCRSLYVRVRKWLEVVAWYTISSVVRGRRYCHASPCVFANHIEAIVVVIIAVLVQINLQKQHQPCDNQRDNAFYRLLKSLLKRKRS
jgi:hypothetical protein